MAVSTVKRREEEEKARFLAENNNKISYRMKWAQQNEPKNYFGDKANFIYRG